MSFPVPRYVVDVSSLRRKIRASGADKIEDAVQLQPIQTFMRASLARAWLSNYPHAPFDLEAQYQQLEREENEEDNPAADADQLVLNHIGHEVPDHASQTWLCRFVVCRFVLVSVRSRFSFHFREHDFIESRP